MAIEIRSMDRVRGDSDPRSRRRGQRAAIAIGNRVVSLELSR